MKTLPASAVTYKRTPDFTHETVPAGLLRSHSTKEGVWGKIVVLEGSLLYRILEPTMEEVLLTPDRHGVVEPTVRHEVVPSADAKFHVEFMREEVRDPKLEPTPAAEVPVSIRKSIYPPPFSARVEGRTKRRLGDHFGLTNFGVNLTELAPGAASALLHHHTLQDEFVYVVSGTATLMLDEKAYTLRAGDCCGFKAGTGIGHQLVNRSGEPVLYLEVGDRTAGDYAAYPEDDLAFTQLNDGAWILTHKDGTPY